MCTLYLVFKEPRRRCHETKGVKPFRFRRFASSAGRLSCDNFPAPSRGTLRAYVGFAFVSTLFSHAHTIFVGASPKTQRPQVGVCEARRPSKQPRCPRPRTSRRARSMNVREPLPACQLSRSNSVTRAEWRKVGFVTWVAHIATWPTVGSRWWKWMNPGRGAPLCRAWGSLRSWGMHFPTRRAAPSPTSASGAGRTTSPSGVVFATPRGRLRLAPLPRAWRAGRRASPD